MPRIRPAGISLATGNASYAPVTTRQSWLPRSGVYWSHQGVRSSDNPSAGQLRASPLTVAGAGSIARIGAVVTVAGSTGSVVRLGVYADDAGGLPGALLLDAGTIDGTSASAQEITLGTPLAVTAGQRIWLCAVNQVAAATLRTVAHAAGGSVDTLANALNANTSGNCWYRTGVTGALPDPFGGTPSPYTGGVLIALRAT